MKAPYTLSKPIGTRATLGLIVLQTDETLEPEFRRFFTAPDVALYVSRVPSGADVTPETLAAMEAEIPRAAGLLPPSLTFECVGYACTSGATVIGPDVVARQVSGRCKTASVTDPLTAVKAALGHLGARRIGMLTPYIESVTAPMRAALEADGYEIGTLASFEEAEEAKVARIDDRSMISAVAGMGEMDAVFLSCTNLRTLDVIAPIEAQLGVPVISSNQALAWHMARSAGIAADLCVGRLMQDGRAG